MMPQNKMQPEIYTTHSRKEAWTLVHSLYPVRFRFDKDNIWKSEYPVFFADLGSDAESTAVIEDHGTEIYVTQMYREIQIEIQETNEAEKNGQKINMSMIPTEKLWRPPVPDTRKKQIARVQYLTGHGILADIKAANYSYQIVDYGWMGVYLTDKTIENPDGTERKLLFSDVDLLSGCEEPTGQREMELSEVRQIFEFVEVTEPEEENMIQCTYPDLRREE